MYVYNSSAVDISDRWSPVVVKLDAPNEEQLAVLVSRTACKSRR